VQGERIGDWAYEEIGAVFAVEGVRSFRVAPDAAKIFIRLTFRGIAQTSYGDWKRSS
jgi:hypothetical protein